MSIRTIVSTFAATIAHLARDAPSRAPLDVVPGTLTRARELVSAVHRVATTSVQDARALLDGTIRFAAYALGYQRAVTTHSPPRPTRTPPSQEARARLLTVPELAARLRIGRSSAYRLAKQLMHAQIGGRLLVPELAVDRYVDEAAIARLPGGTQSHAGYTFDVKNGGTHGTAGIPSLKPPS